METPTRRAVLYVRASTTDQTITLDDQERKLRAHAMANDLTVVAVCVDAGVSARDLDRPALTRALALLDSGEATMLVVTKLDRLTRSVRDLGDLGERYFARGAALVSLGDSIDTSTASGRLVLHILGSVAQWEREAISERTKEALAELKRQGRKLGRPRKDGPTCEAINALRLQGLSWREVANALGCSVSAARLRAVSA